MTSALIRYALTKINKKFKRGLFKHAGKNFTGKICVAHRGGGNKQAYRHIDFYRRIDTFGVVCSIQQDPNRTAFIGLVLYTSGFFSYIILSDSIKEGQQIYSGTTFFNSLCLSQGSAIPACNVGLFSIVSNIELRPKFGASLARAAGSGALLVDITSKVITLKLKSSWIINLPRDSMVSIGYVSNMSSNMQIIGRAGKNRGLGKRPHVRGVAMNPCDHPHGGGNGKTSPPTVPVNFLGKPTKWTHTKKKKVDRIKRSLFKKIR